MKVVELFDSIDGEGIRSGLPCSFIRLAGCDLRCAYCDTSYALFNEAEECRYSEMTAAEIIAKLDRSYHRVTLTGGEPLIHEGVYELLQGLLASGFATNIETNGAVDIAPFLDLKKQATKMFFSIDYKLPSSGMSDKMHRDNFYALDTDDVLKFVVGSDEDVRKMSSVMQKLRAFYNNKMPHVYASAVYGKYSYEKLVNILLTDEIFADTHFGIQLQKIVWDPDKRSV